MKTFMTVPIAAGPSRTIREPKTIRYKFASRQGRLRRFQHFIESTDWDEKYLCNKLIDKICLGVIILAALCFVPVMVSICLR